MKNLHIYGMMVLAGMAMSACQADTEPELQEPTEFVLNTPPFATQIYELTPEGTMELTCSQPNYGLTLATTYSLEASLLEDFGDGQPEPGEDETPLKVSLLIKNPQSTVLKFDTKALAEAMCKMRGITEADDYTNVGPLPVYFRATAAVNNQAITRITSNTVMVANVQDYCAIAPKAKYITLYTPGASNGWNQGASQQIRQYPENGKEIYKGFAYLKDEFKFTSAPDWNGTNYGAADDEGKLSIDGGAGNLTVPAEGLYYCVVNTTDLTYSVTLIESVGICDDGTTAQWSADAPVELTSDGSYLKWTVTTNFSDGSFKFVFNKGWDINLGGKLDELDFNGDNIPATAGTATVTLDLTQLPYTAKVQ